MEKGNHLFPNTIHICPMSFKLLVACEFIVLWAQQLFFYQIEFRNKRVIWEGKLLRSCTMAVTMQGEILGKIYCDNVCTVYPKDMEKFQKCVNFQFSQMFLLQNFPSSVDASGELIKFSQESAHIQAYYDVFPSLKYKQSRGGLCTQSQLVHGKKCQLQSSVEQSKNQAEKSH